MPAADQEFCFAKGQEFDCVKEEEFCFAKEQEFDYVKKGFDWQKINLTMSKKGFAYAKGQE